MFSCLYSLMWNITSWLLLLSFSFSSECISTDERNIFEMKCTKFRKFVKEIQVMRPLAHYRRQLLLIKVFCIQMFSKKYQNENLCTYWLNENKIGLNTKTKVMSFFIFFFFLFIELSPRPRLRNRLRTHAECAQ